jgi:hypothetical protein
MEIGSFAELEKRHSCPFCSFVKTMCLVSLPWNWIKMLRDNPAPMKIHSGPGAWVYFEALDPGPQHIAPCAYISHPDFSDDKTTFFQNFLGPCVLWKLDTNSQPALSPRIRKKMEVIDGKLDFELVKSWIARCTENHLGCNRESPPRLSSGVTPYLIDVEREEIIRSKPEYVYVALSYVWGSEDDEKTAIQSEDSGFEISLGGGQQLPLRGKQNPLSEACKTVRDAMKVVKGIGIKYLWVDSYCISSDPEQRALHIKQMDKIYAGAWLTILALSGHNANAGLPGISVPLQITPQPYTNLEIGRIVATRLPQPLADAAISPWNKRGWTMQEAALSRRCLCFTEISTFWLCEERLQYDFVEAELVRQKDNFTTFPFSVASIQRSFSIEHFRELIEQCSGRDLTHSSDALDAITGILAYITEKTGVEFCYGQPQSYFVRSLLWKSDNTRRYDFPSWTWLGWREEVTVPVWLENREKINEPNIFGVELENGKSETYFAEELDIATVIRYPKPEHQLPTLTLCSQVARFQTFKLMQKGGNFIPAERYIHHDDDGEIETHKAMHDLWCIHISHPHTAPCPHNLIGYMFGSDGNACFGTDPEISELIGPSGSEHEFFLLVHWRECIQDEQKNWIPVPRDHFEGDEGIGDVVLAIMIVRDSNHNAHRVALVPIPYKDWLAASPDNMLVDFM